MFVGHRALAQWHRGIADLFKCTPWWDRRAPFFGAAETAHRSVIAVLSWSIDLSDYGAEKSAVHLSVDTACRDVLYRHDGDGDW